MMCMYVCVCMRAELCQTLCDSMNCRPLDSSVHGNFQARIREWVAISYARGSSGSRNWTRVSCVSWIGRQILYHCTTWEAHVYTQTHTHYGILLIHKTEWNSSICNKADGPNKSIMPGEISRKDIYHLYEGAKKINVYN